MDEFLELTAIANPHAQITFVPPSRVAADDSQDDLPLANAKTEKSDGGLATSVAGEATTPQGVDPTITTIEKDGVILFPRAVEELPPETKEIKPHPRGVELGTLLQMIKDYEASDGGTLYQFLQDAFCKVSAQRAGDSLRSRGTHKSHANRQRRAPACGEAVQSIPGNQARSATDGLFEAPIGVRQLLAGMLKGVKAEFYAASSRDPDVYRGRPFQIEAAIAFGGELPADDTARVIRFANRVPLLFQQSACSSLKACIETSWRNYNLSQPRGGLPVGPLVIMIHMASVWVPFTSESKEAIADYDEIRKEMKLALMECGRKLGAYLHQATRPCKRFRAARRDVFERYIGEIAKSINAINGTDTKKLYEALLKEAKKRTAIADAKLDEEGKMLKKDETEDLKKDEGVVMVESRAAHLGQEAAARDPLRNRWQNARGKWRSCQTQEQGQKAKEESIERRRSFQLISKERISHGLGTDSHR